MIKKIGIENFRIFKELTEFELAPITVLTGTNNSGKSSFLKMMNLLQQSVRDIGSLNVLNFIGGNHNLGTFGNAVNWESDKENITLVVDFPLDYFDEGFKLELVYRKMGEIGYIKSYKVFSENRDLLIIDDIVLDDNYNYQSFVKNEDFMYSYNFSFDLEYIKKFIYQEIIKNSTISDNLIKTSNDFIFYTYNLRNEEGKINLNESIKNKLESPYLDLRDDLLLVERSINQVKVSTNSFQLKNKNSDLFTDSFDEIDEPLFLWKYENYLGETLSKKFKSNLLKSNSEYNVFDENVSVVIEPENLNVFRKLVINNIQNSLNKIKYSLKNVDFISAQRGNSDGEIEAIAKSFYSLQLDLDNRFISKSLDLLDIKGELKIDRVQGRFTAISILKNDKKTNIADLGYGYSQVIPILLKIVLSAQLNKTNKSTITDKAINESPSFGSYIDSLKPILVIEEPEANLHPNLQSKLADVFVLAYKTFGTRFILETHSEYFIRKLQYLTAKKEITQDDTVIYYFNTDENVSEEEPKVKSIEITRNGNLTDRFGIGFYDEAISLEFKLSKLNQAQQN